MKLGTFYNKQKEKILSLVTAVEKGRYLPLSQEFFGLGFGLLGVFFLEE